MKQLIALLVGVATGLGVGWYLARDGGYRPYRTTTDLTIWASNGDNMVLPAGTPLLSAEPLTGSVDLAWWAFAPIYFNSAQEALDRGIRPADEFEGPGEFTLSGSGDFGRVPAGAEQPHFGEED